MNDEAQGGNREATKTYRDLLVWQRAHEFVLRVYEFSNSFPKHELFGLTSQLRNRHEDVSRLLNRYESAVSPKFFSWLIPSLTFFAH